VPQAPAGKKETHQKFFALRVVRPWPRLPSEVGDAPSLETSKARLDGALSSLIQLEMSLLTAGGWAPWPLKVPSSPNYLMIL